MLGQGGRGMGGQGHGLGGWEARGRRPGGVPHGRGGRYGLGGRGGLPNYGGGNGRGGRGRGGQLGEAGVDCSISLIRYMRDKGPKCKQDKGRRSPAPSPRKSNENVESSPTLRPSPTKRANVARNEAGDGQEARPNTSLRPKGEDSLPDIDGELNNCKGSPRMAQRPKDMQGLWDPWGGNGGMLRPHGQLQQMTLPPPSKPIWTKPGAEPRQVGGK